MEEWKDIQGYEGLYQVSNYGRVRSLERIVIRSDERHYSFEGKILNPTKKRSGHLIVSLPKNQYLIHRLVAEAFIPNPNNYTIVHHINRNPQDNRVENLIWMSDEQHKAEHVDDRANAAKKALSKRVDQIDAKTGEVLRQWESTIEAARKLGYNFGNICACCRGERKTHKGYVWKYVVENNIDTI